MCKVIRTFVGEGQTGLLVLPYVVETKGSGEGGRIGALRDAVDKWLTYWDSPLCLNEVGTMIAAGFLIHTQLLFVLEKFIRSNISQSIMIYRISSSFVGIFFVYFFCAYLIP